MHIIRCSGGLLVPYSGGIIEFSVLSAIRPQAANFNHSSVLQAFMLADSVGLAMSGHQHVRASDMRHFYFAIHDITVTARYTHQHQRHHIMYTQQGARPTDDRCHVHHLRFSLKICAKTIFRYQWPWPLTFLPQIWTSSYTYPGHVSVKFEVSTAFRLRVTHRHGSGPTDRQTYGYQRSMLPGF